MTLVRTYRRNRLTRQGQLQVVLAVSRRLNGLQRGEWRRLLSRCKRCHAKWEPPKQLRDLAAA